MVLHLQWTNSITGKQNVFLVLTTTLSRGHTWSITVPFIYTKIFLKFKTWFTLFALLSIDMLNLFPPPSVVLSWRKFKQHKTHCKSINPPPNSQINRIPLSLAYIHFKCLSQTTYNKLILIYLQLIQYKILNYKPYCEMLAEQSHDFSDAKSAMKRAISLHVALDYCTQFVKELCLRI